MDPIELSARPSQTIDSPTRCDLKASAPTSSRPEQGPAAWQLLIRHAAPGRADVHRPVCQQTSTIAVATDRELQFPRLRDGGKEPQQCLTHPDSALRGW